MSIHITCHKKGLKMEGFISINTSVKLNPYCIKAQKNQKSICAHCYALKMENSYARLRSCLKNNYEILSAPLTDDQLNEVVLKIRMENKLYIRFNSLGELTNLTNLLNYFKICEALPDLKFALWTKRSDIVNMIKNKPSNLSLIYSNPCIDQPIEKIPDKFNGVFNVVTYEHAINNNVKPSCKGQCMACLKCYKGNNTVVTELLKKDSNLITKGLLEAL